MLVSEHLLTYDTHRGYFVNDVDLTQMADVYLVRTLLEAEVFKTIRWPSEEELATRFEQLFAEVPDPHRIVFNAHVPPFDSGLDEAPVLDANLTVTQQAGQVKLGPVGSRAVRAAIESHQPIASLHGHVHESAGFRRIGSTMAVNPGSDYGTGSLNGALMTLSSGKLKSHQMVRG